MMLSTVAERVYWTARYLERVESTARLVTIYDKLLFDIPRSIKLNWYNLITINRMEEEFNLRFSVKDERNVVKFLLYGDKVASVHSSLQAIKENVRTTRDVVPEETWELVNELCLFAHDNIQLSINRSQRHEFLDSLIKGCRQITGLLYGSMPQNEAWEFLRLGRHLELADMTTRNLDAGVAAILEIDDDENAVNSHQIVWGNVLRSLNAAQYYRRHTRTSVQGGAVVHYLLEDGEFPKSISHCLNAMVDSCEKLPRSKGVMKALKHLQASVFSTIDYDELGDPLREHLNQLQIELANIHTKVSETWFPIIV